MKQHASHQDGLRQRTARQTCGTGSRSRFRIPQILEFYAATEGGVSLFNVEGKRGAIGRIPGIPGASILAASWCSLMSRRASRSGTSRDSAFVALRTKPAKRSARFWTTRRTSAAGSRATPASEASEKKILRDVFKPGDAWFRTGDLMRRTSRDFSISSIASATRSAGKVRMSRPLRCSEAICARFQGSEQANVYGVAIPGADGRAGMATIVPDGDLDLTALHGHLIGRLPGYARPVFLRIQREIEVTSTFKYTTVGLAREGYDPHRISDAIYFNDPESQSFVRLDQPRYDRLQLGEALEVNHA